MNTPDAYLYAIAYELGETHGIEQIPELREDEDKRETLLALGLEKFCASKEYPVEMAKRALLKTLNSAAVSPLDIDAVIYASDSFWCNAALEANIHQLLLDLSLLKAEPIVLSMGGCANFSRGLELALGMFPQGYKNILLVTSDCTSDHVSRVLQPNTAVMSDAAASCLLTTSKPINAGFKIKSTGHAADITLWNKQPEVDFVSYAKGQVDGVKLAVQRCVEKIHCTLSDFHHLIMNNYNLSVMNMFSSALGFKRGMTFTANVGRLAHAYAADCLINVADMQNAQKVKSGEFLLLVGFYHTAWGSVALEVI